MKLIVGLGNPGANYEKTRHNVGFRVIEELAKRWQIKVNRRRFSGCIGNGHFGDQRVALLKPTTSMNLSGLSVREAMCFYKLALEDLLVVMDDLALPVGRIRIRPQGSGGGHKGLTNVIYELGYDAFARLRIGIGSAEAGHMVDHVLNVFTQQEEEEITKAIHRAAEAIESWLVEGVAAAMNSYNCPDE